MADLGIVRFDLLGEGAGAAVALWLTLEPQAEIGSVVLAAPAGVPDEAFRQVTRPVREAKVRAFLARHLAQATSVLPAAK